VPWAPPSVNREAAEEYDAVVKAITVVLLVFGMARIAGAEKVKAVKVTVLSTMLSGPPGKGIGEWGFAALVEVDGRKLLVDTGARPETVLRNIDEMKVDLTGVTDVVLTHFHDDHTGGLLRLREELRKKNPKALMRAHVGAEFFAVRVVDGKDVDREALRKGFVALGGAWVEHAKPVELLPGVWMTGPVPRKHDERNWSGKAQLRRGKTVVEDTVPDDSSIVIETAKGLVVITGCGHAGVVNIVEYARALRGGSVHALIGGLHLFELGEDKLVWTGKQLKAAGVQELLGVHCTGIEAVFRLRELLGLQPASAVNGGVGATFELGKGIVVGGLAK
jgi:7,8-dihydropterin-6-yl-methyl-4-(beta-D-ribofuranosyl)aminobenzene 5'-phosphate synthase